MRRQMLAGVVLVAVVAGARPVYGAADEVGESADALPGLGRLPVVGPLGTGAAAAMSAGYGYVGGVLGTSDSHQRSGGSLAVSARPLRWLGCALRFDGRYTWDKDTAGTDDSFVSDLRFAARAGTALTEQLRLGGELRVWFPPGGSMPSVAGRATSVDFALLLAHAPTAPVRLAATAGFRLDNSGASEDDPNRLSRADRLALGVSEARAVLLGVGGLWRLRGVEVFAEWTWDLLVGSKAPAAVVSPMRIAAGARAAVASALEAGLIVESSPSRRPAVDQGQPLVPVEPRVRVLLTLAYLYGYPPTRLIEPEGAAASHPVAASLPAAEPAAAPVSGRVLSETGAPLAGARVSITSGGRSLEETTGSDGEFRFARVPAGAAQLMVVFKDHRRHEQALAVTQGGVPALTIALVRTTPVGQLSGVTQSFAGKPVAATILVVPGEVEVTARRDGTFQIDLPPGEYTVTIRAPGFAEQQRRVKVERNGATIMNIDLRRRGE